MQFRQSKQKLLSYFLAQKVNLLLCILVQSFNALSASLDLPKIEKLEKVGVKLSWEKYQGRDDVSYTLYVTKDNVYTKTKPFVRGIYGVEHTSRSVISWNLSPGVRRYKLKACIGSNCTESNWSAALVLEGYSAPAPPVASVRYQDITINWGSFGDDGSFGDGVNSIYYLNVEKDGVEYNFTHYNKPAHTSYSLGPGTRRYRITKCIGTVCMPRSGWSNSASIAAPYVSPPTIMPNGGTIKWTDTIDFLSPVGKVRYAVTSVNGRCDHVSWLPLPEPIQSITLPKSSRVCAKTILENNNESEIVYADFDVTSQLPTPSITPGYRVIDTETVIRINSSEPDVDLFYKIINIGEACPETYDNFLPYVKWFKLLESSKICAISRKTGFFQSEIQDRVYYFQPKAPIIFPNGGLIKAKSPILIQSTAFKTKYTLTSVGASCSEVSNWHESDGAISLTNSSRVCAKAISMENVESEIAFADFDVSSAKQIILIHTDLLGSPVAETNGKGEVQ